MYLDRGQVPLSKLIRKVAGGGTPARSMPRFWGGGVPWASVKDFRDDAIDLNETVESITPEGLRHSAAHLIPAATPIVCTRMAIGRCAAFGIPVAINQDLKALEPGHGVAPRYLLHVLKHLQPRLEARAVGSTVKGIALIELLSSPVLVVPADEQKRIAEILDTVDEAIRRTEQVIAKLQQMKQGLLHDLLTRGIDDNGCPRDFDSRNSFYVDSDLGRLPVGWTVRALADVAQVRSGIAKNEGRVVSDACWVHYLRVANVQDGYLDLSEMSKIRISRMEIAKYTVLPGDLLMNEGGDLDKLGRGTIWRGEYEPCVHQNHVFVVRSRPGVLPDYLDAWTGSPTARRYFLVAGKQTTNLASINKTALGRLPVAVPSLAEQERIITVLAGMESRIAAEHKDLDKLRAIKLGLRDDLLSGRVRVQVVEEVGA